MADYGNGQIIEALPKLRTHLAGLVATGSGTTTSIVRLPNGQQSLFWLSREGLWHKQLLGLFQSSKEDATTDSNPDNTRLPSLHSQARLGWC